MLHPELQAHHESMHAQMVEDRKPFHKLITDHADHVDHHIIENIKTFNKLTERMINDHNLEARQMAKDLKTPFKALKNNYKLDVPKIGKYMAGNYCQCEHHESAAETEDYCQCTETEKAPLVQSTMEPTKNLSAKLQTMTFDDSLIPAEYKGVVSFN
jgi:hypothetical protein